MPLPLLRGCAVTLPRLPQVRLAADGAFWHELPAAVTSPALAFCCIALATSFSSKAAALNLSRVAATRRRAARRHLALL